MSSNLYLNVHKNFENEGTYRAYVFGEAGEEVSVQNNAGYSTTFALDSDGFFSLLLPIDVVMMGSGINERGLEITADGDISAFLATRQPATTDLSIIFEKQSLGTAYVIASYSQPGGSFDEGGQFSVQALEDDTIVNFTLPDGQTGNVTLDEGQTYKFAAASGDADRGIATDESFDITGTLIATTKTTAVFSGSACTNIRFGACDHIVEQMPAVNFLSTNYVLGEHFNDGSGNNTVRVVAATDDTVVTLNESVVVATLGAGEFYEFLLSEPAARIQTSNPALVAQYLSGATTAGDEGDPAMSFVPGTETWLAEYAVATPAGDEAFAANLINVVIPTSAIGSLRLNGAAVDVSLFTAIAGTDLSVANIDIDPGILRAQASAAFQLSVFGYDFFDSFLTFGGASFASGIVNAPPNAVADAYTVSSGREFIANILDNDSDPEGDPLTVLGVPDDVDNGTLTVEDSGSFSYISDAGFEGTDTFTYTVQDGLGGVDTATVTLTVTPADVNTPPVANDDAYTTDEDVPLVITASGVLNNDTDVDGTVEEAVLGTGPSNGTLMLNDNGSFTYTPDENFFGSDSFTYRAIDDGDQFSDLATVSLTINEVDEPEPDDCVTVTLTAPSETVDYTGGHTTYLNFDTKNGPETTSDTLNFEFKGKDYSINTVKSLLDFVKFIEKDGNGFTDAVYDDDGNLGLILSRNSDGTVKDGIVLDGVIGRDNITEAKVATAFADRPNMFSDENDAFCGYFGEPSDLALIA